MVVAIFKKSTVYNAVTLNSFVFSQSICLTVKNFSLPLLEARVSLLSWDLLLRKTIQEVETTQCI